MRELLLMKSNLRKSRGISVGITILILSVALLLSAGLIILFDFLPDSSKQRERLNAGDCNVIATLNIEGYDEEFFSETLKGDVSDFNYTAGFGIQYDVKYGG